MTPDMFELLARIDRTHWWFVARRSILRDVLATALPAGRPSLIVDIGCGTGANIAALSTDGGHRGVGIDTSADAIAFAQRRFPKVQFVCGQAPHDVGDALGAADACLMMDVLEHVEDDRGLLGRIVHALRPGALALITVPADMRLWSRHDEQLGHLRRYDAASLRATWGGLPVDEIAVTHFCRRLYAVARLQRWLTRRSRGDGAAAWDMPVPVAPVNAMLRRIFAGESGRLVDLLRGRRAAGYTRGVSLLALLRRGAP